MGNHTAIFQHGLVADFVGCQNPDQSWFYAQSDDFYAMLGLGPIVEGYSLIGTVAHVPSMPYPRLKFVKAASNRLMPGRK